MCVGVVCVRVHIPFGAGKCSVMHNFVQSIGSRPHSEPKTIREKKTTSTIAQLSAAIEAIIYARTEPSTNSPAWEIFTPYDWLQTNNHQSPGDYVTTKFLLVLH